MHLEEEGIIAATMNAPSVLEVKTVRSTRFSEKMTKCVTQVFHFVFSNAQVTAVGISKPQLYLDLIMEFLVDECL